MTTVRWDRPIQFQNGQPCTLIETRADGRRIISRDGVTGQTSRWEMPPDGQLPGGSVGERLGYSIINTAPAGSPASTET